MGMGCYFLLYQKYPKNLTLLVTCNILKVRGTSRGENEIPFPTHFQIHTAALS